MARPQRGATLVLVTLMALGLTAVAGLAADAGAMYYKRTQLQAAADAAALAGARGLQDGKNVALSEAKRLAAANGYALPSKDVSFPKGSRVKVRLTERQPLLLAPLLGTGEPEIAASSGGELHCVGQSFGLRPWGVPDADFVRGQDVAFKVGPGDGQRGNYQALALDGPGARVYFESILYGARRDIKAGDLVPTEPGNVSGPTQRAVEQLIGFDRTAFEPAVKQGDKAVRIVKLALLDPRSYAEAKGRSEVRIAGFARFYLVKATSRGDVIGKFVERIGERTVAGTAPQYAVRLVE
ncbi:MAG: hypothetical protein FJZ01_21890 [Candidatus Sericytochromatia bacterium]|nr:hypothetical protein [Candidatus Tanganyikabacteria bacterium]